MTKVKRCARAAGCGIANVGAVRLWKTLLFDVVGTLPRAFPHPRMGLVDSFVMHRQL